MAERLRGKVAVVAGASRGCGRGVAALAADADVMRRSGELVFVGDAAKEYGFTDIDGRYVENFYRATGRW